ncbi:MAG: YajG family lipoprotein [Nitrospinaceae bacterium]
MRIFCFLTFSVLIWFGSWGCSQRHTVTIDPALPVSRSDLGRSRTIGLEVADARPSNLIAKWKGTFNFRRFTINPDPNLVETIYQKISKGLRIVDYNPKRLTMNMNRTLKVEIQQIKSIYHKRGPQMGVKVHVQFRATCENKNSTPPSVYKKSFSGNRNRDPIPPTSFPNEKMVNDTISGVLGKLFADRKLLHCLAQ